MDAVQTPDEFQGQGFFFNFGRAPFFQNEKRKNQPGKPLNWVKKINKL